MILSDLRVARAMNEVPMYYTMLNIHVKYSVHLLTTNMSRARSTLCSYLAPGMRFIDG